MQKLKKIAAELVELIRQARESYEAGTAFMRMRVWVLGFLGLDVLVTAIFVLTFGGPILDVVVWFEHSFPSNMIVLRNNTGEELKEVTLILDGRYKLAVEAIEPGPNGYEVNRAFRDEGDQLPNATYIPASLDVLRPGKDPVRIPIGTSKQAGHN